MNNSSNKQFPAVRWVVMGVSGCGKSSIGQALADALGCRYVEGDSFHPAANVARMAAGIALTDADRSDWLLLLQGEIAAAGAAGESLVLSCSALKRRYRDLLRLGDPALRFAHLAGPRELIAERMAARVDHYMPPSLLDSQLRDLEALQDDEAGLTLNLADTPQRLVANIVQSPGMSA
jgi:gluconokinase